MQYLILHFTHSQCHSKGKAKSINILIKQTSKKTLQIQRRSKHNISLNQLRPHLEFLRLCLVPNRHDRRLHLLNQLIYMQRLPLAYPNVACIA